MNPKPKPTKKKRTDLLLEKLFTIPKPTKKPKKTARQTINSANSSPRYKVLQRNSSNGRKPTRKHRRKYALADLVTRVRTPKLSPMTTEEIEARSEMLYNEHLFATFQALKFIRSLPPLSAADLEEKTLILPRAPECVGRKTVVFDLDETLVHCCEDITYSKPDYVVPIRFPNHQVVKAGINVRPYAVECLTYAAKLFEVIVFTASHQCYADEVLDILDPTGELIQYRLYRENCVMNQGVFIKDLRLLNRELSQVVIIDNAAYSFAYQLDNGVPIISWHDDYYDRELLNLMDYLRVLAEADDVRPLNRETFKLQTFYEDYIEEVLDGDENIVRSRSPDIISDLASQKT